MLGSKDLLSLYIFYNSKNRHLGGALLYFPTNWSIRNVQNEFPSRVSSVISLYLILSFAHAWGDRWKTFLHNYLIVTTKKQYYLYNNNYMISRFPFWQCEEKYRNTLEKCELAEQRLAQFQRKAEQLPGVEKQLAERMQNLQQVGMRLIRTVALCAICIVRAFITHCTQLLFSGPRIARDGGGEKSAIVGSAGGNEAGIAKVWWIERYECA